MNRPAYLKNLESVVEKHLQWRQKQADETSNIKVGDKKKKK
jgi:hypothetical protein